MTRLQPVAATRPTTQICPLFPPVVVPFTVPSPVQPSIVENELTQRFPRLDADVEADVVVVGAGLAGLGTAYRLAKASKRVVVLESRLVGCGTAGRRMGLISPWSEAVTFRELERAVGLERTRQVAAAQAAAASFVEAVVYEERIECGLARLEGAVVVEVGVDVAAADAASKEMREELAACCRAGLDGPRSEWQQRAGDAGCGQGRQQQPQRSPANGAAEGECVVSGPSGGVVKTMHGPVGRASLAVVLATHSPINRNQLAIHDRQLPKRVYTVGIQVPEGAVPPHFAHMTALPSPAGAGWPWPLFAAAAVTAPLVGGASGGGRRSPASTRLAPLPPHRLVSGEGGGGAGGSYESNKQLLLVRGALHHHGHDEKQYGDPYGSLAAWARTRFPECGRVLYSWSSTEYHPGDLLGLYGRDDPLDVSRPPVYVLTGHGGQEWTNATLGSEAVAGAILGGAALPPWAETYRPSRFLPGTTSKLASELAVYFSTVAVSLLKHVVPRGLGDVAGMLAPGSVERQLGPGEGRVAQHGLLKKALYRDEGGTLHLRSAFCTHLGCCVK
ncbi:hypothetical protein GPECTOR_58g551 [Gonium pectorale]|uniref:Rieske domain-containing protein n=1 Tax=Gonium pectorale TaxID=33097 RepID=A0A150G5H1_GONPE|nr:hypothetical protein GPECTOR_58g551 [Gonium pectorale]|eukprot:KXZ45102.1 hypothetical protein GPECTOR_58g551 [Gonium pectorale]